MGETMVDAQGDGFPVRLHLAIDDRLIHERLRRVVEESSRMAVVPTSDGADVVVIDADRHRAAQVILSRRESQVLQLITRGDTNRQIAAALEISERTVKSHVTRMLRRLGVVNRASAIAWGRAHPEVLVAAGAAAET